MASVASGGGGLGGGVSSEYVEDVAGRTLDAAAAGLDRALGDTGLCFTFYLLTQIALASREEDWRPRLRRLGISLSQDAWRWRRIAGYSKCFVLLLH